MKDTSQQTFTLSMKNEDNVVSPLSFVAGRGGSEPGVGKPEPSLAKDKRQRAFDHTVCAVITEESVEGARAAISEAADVADLVEIRLDFLKDFDFSDIDALRRLLEDKPLPAIITCRAVSEGGRQQVDDRVRLRLLIEGARQLADYCDIEAYAYGEASKLAPDLSRLIVSYHNFDETPLNLTSVYETLTRLEAAIHKIAVRAGDIRDQLELFRMLERAQSEGRTLIAVAMEESGLVTRILGPGYGSFLTYGTLGRGRESAPGQITCEELTDLYRIHQVSRRTAVTGIIGCPVSHSASPAMHNRAFAALGLDFVYLPMRVNEVAEFVARFARPRTREIDWPLEGFSVTIPHKTSILALLDEVDETARRVGAVNTVVIQEGRLVGYNTDAEGAIEPLEKVVALEGAACAIIGAGGAARAVAYGLIERGARVSVFARDCQKAGLLAEEFALSVLPIDWLASSDADVIINATPVGMRSYASGHSVVPREALKGRKVAYDLVYNPLETEFLKSARNEGCITIGGLEMLVAQAAAQFKLWTRFDAPAEIMRSAALEHLHNQA